MSNIKLVEARVGLTNYYHDQVIRNPVLDIDSTLIDELTSENHAGGIQGSTLRRAAVMSGGLNAQPSGWAEIAGNGWNESKGLMMLKLMVQDSQVMVEYMNVIGYVTNNDAQGGLSRSAMFHPSMSWRTQEVLTSSMDINNPTSVKRQTGGRTDYMYNDGSNTTGSMITLRPSDVVDYGLEKATHDDIMDRMLTEGLPGMQPSTTVAASDINRVGVIASKRGNINPALYAEDILKAGTDYQRNQMFSGGGAMTAGAVDSQFDGMFGELSNLSYQASNREPTIMRDNFFVEMNEMMGSTQMRGFRGWTIGDLEMVFSNINEVLDIVIMDASDFSVEDYTQTTESFGTASQAEFIAHEIEMNILDLLLKYNLNGLSFRGSNCDNYGDEGLDNIVIFPYNPAPLQDNDFQLGQKVEAFISELRSQIFAKLNGVRSSQLVPLRFEVTAELFGTCSISVEILSSQSGGSHFNLDDSGSTAGMISRVFPTFAINSTSSILGNSNTAAEAGAQFFNNLGAYFQ